MKRDMNIAGENVSIYSTGACRESVHGPIRSEDECLKIIDMCRTGALQRVTSRLSENERMEIRPGSIYVYEEEESGISRWTDGKMWSSSKVYGRCLIYYEVAPVEHEKTQKALYSSADSIPSLLRLGKEVIKRESNLCQQPQRAPLGLIKMSTSACYQGNTFHLVSYTTTAYMKSGTQSPIWKMIAAWEVPRNFHLRMSYRRKRASLQGINRPRKETRRTRSWPHISASMHAPIPAFNANDYISDYISVSNDNSISSSKNTNTSSSLNNIEVVDKTPVAEITETAPIDIKEYMEEENFLKDYLNSSLHWENENFLM